MLPVRPCSLHPLNSLLKRVARDRKSTRLNSSHGYVSYAVLGLKKKSEPATVTRTSPGVRATHEGLPASIAFTTGGSRALNGAARAGLAPPPGARAAGGAMASVA